jgi:hypothetical protein
MSRPKESGLLLGGIRRSHRIISYDLSGAGLSKSLFENLMLRGIGRVLLAV